MRLIDAEKEIAKLQEMLGVLIDEGDKTAVRFALNILNNADTVDSGHDGVWIPCSERLPEKGVIVLTQTAKGYMTTNKRVDFDNHETWFWGGNYIAWMPLPKPYREEATE